MDEGFEKSLAVREDARKVEELFLIDHLAQPRPKLKTYRYDMPGDKEISQSQFLIIDIETRKITEIDIDRWPRSIRGCFVYR